MRTVFPCHSAALLACSWALSPATEGGSGSLITVNSSGRSVSGQWRRLLCCSLCCSGLHTLQLSAGLRKVTHILILPLYLLYCPYCSWRSCWSLEVSLVSCRCCSRAARLTPIEFDCGVSTPANRKSQLGSHSHTSLQSVYTPDIMLLVCTQLSLIFSCSRTLNLQ